VFSVRSVPMLYNEEKLPLRDSLETAVRRVGGSCELAASLQGREPGSRGISAVGKTLPCGALKTVTEKASLCVMICRI
jgi:hypothetical protein